jgi:tungstate transport system substrate-binding protein
MHKSHKFLNLFLAFVLIVGLVGLVTGCSSDTTTNPPATTTTTKATTPAVTTTTPAPVPTTTTVAPPANPEIIMASTTSTRDTGLMDVLLPVFEKETGYKVKPVYVGSGAAITMGKEGNADVLLVHSPSQEKTFMDDGWGINRSLVMHNYFIVVGPKSDPAGIKGTATGTAAFQKIADTQSLFYSRGDKSGTDTTEKALWKKIGITVADNATSNPAWYLEGGAGTGMLDLLRIASEKQGYSLTDYATYLFNKAVLDLDIMVQGDPGLINIYHVIPVNPDKWPKINAAGAKAFAAFMVSKEAQDIIANYGKDKYAQALFFADAGKTEAEFGSY